jgi:N-methylhydantoinase B
VEATIPRENSFVQMHLYANESFPKGQGQLGANPGSRASFRLRASTEVAQRLEAGEVPQEFDSLGGEELPVAFKGAPLDVPPGFAWEWVSPSAAGWGDPLLREPADVVGDLEAGLLDADAALRVYGVVVGSGGAVDEPATASTRREVRRSRLGNDPGEPVEPPAGARRAGELLHVVDGRWWCNGADLGPASASWKAGAAHVSLGFDALAPEFIGTDAEMAEKIVVHAWYCPVTGYRLDLELARGEESPLIDMVLSG